MFSTISLLAVGLLAAVSNAASKGDSGVLSSLDGGLGGTVSVWDANTLNITNYKLKDASAPALYVRNTP